MSPAEILEWCATHNVLVRFHSNKTVEVTLNSLKRRRKTLVEAIVAHEHEAKRKPNEAFCRAPSCGRLVLWVPNAQGRRIPVDPELVNAIVDDGGDLTLVLQDGSSRKARRPQEREIPNVQGRVVHGKGNCASAETFQEERITEVAP